MYSNTYTYTNKAMSQISSHSTLSEPPSMSSSPPEQPKANVEATNNAAAQQSATHPRRRRKRAAKPNSTPSDNPGSGPLVNDANNNMASLVNQMKNPELFTDMLVKLAQHPHFLNMMGHIYCQRFLRSNCEDDINKAISAHNRAADSTTSDDPDYGMYVCDIGAALGMRFALTGNLLDIDQAISMLQVGIANTIEGDANYPSQLKILGHAFETRFKCTSDFMDNASAISTYQKVIQFIPEGDTFMSCLLHKLGNLFDMHFKITDALTDSANAISALQKSVQLTPEGHVCMSSHLHSLGQSFRQRFKRTGDLSDIASAISTYQKIIKITPEGGVDMSCQLHRLGNSFQERFEITGELEDIATAISTLQKSVQLTPEGHAHMPSHLRTLGNSFRARFGRTADLTDIASAISTLQRAIQLTPEGDAQMPFRLNDLGISLKKRFERTGDPADIANAISNLQQAIQTTPEGDVHMACRFNALGTFFEARFERTSDLADVASAISTHQKAVHLTPEGHAHMPAHLRNLASSLHSRSNHTGDLADIATAISILQRAVSLTPEGDIKMVCRLNDLGISFLERFKSTNDLADNASGISILQKVIQLTPQGDPFMSSLLNNLGTSFDVRFQRTDDIVDVSNAISALQKAVQLTPEGDAGMPRTLYNLGNSFHTRFICTRNLKDIESAISNTRKAVELAQGGQHIIPSLFSIGNCLYTRFIWTGNIVDIVDAISALQKAIQISPKGYVNMSCQYNSLGKFFQMRFKRTGDIADIGNAVSTNQRAIQLTPDGHACMSSHLNTLATSLINRFSSTHNVEDIHEAISVFRRSASQITGHPSKRLQSACSWAHFSDRYDKLQLLDAFSLAIQLLPQVAGLEQTIHKRHQTLINHVSDITASAAAAALNVGNLEIALTWLEQGRCLVWNQINHLRNPADDLRAHNSSLADRFLKVAHDLEESGSRQERHCAFLESGDMTEMISLQEKVHTHVHLAKEWNDLLLEIRRIPGLSDFLQPPQASKLLSRLPSDGPIVIFNIHKDRCDALALISGRDSPIHIPLKTFSLQQAIQLSNDIRRYLKNQNVRQRQEASRSASKWHPEGVDMYKVLRELWEHVAKPILDALAYSPNHSNQPHIWWCATGPLAFLPIHAAGIYGKGTSALAGPCVSDYVVSSYIPTITALLDKIKQATTTDLRSTSLLIISQSQPSKSTPGLAGAKEESDLLKDMIGKSFKSLFLNDNSATVNRVMEEMKAYSWVHFACHAIQDVDEPLKSGVQLHFDVDDLQNKTHVLVEDHDEDVEYPGRLKLSEMMKQTLPDADFAFLSGCQTGTGDEKLADEVVHLAAGMLAAGYRSVVATMWSIKDRYGPTIAKDFYSYILKANLGNEQLESANAARALHYATQKIRKELKDTEEAFLIWVPYVHFGV